MSLFEDIQGYVPCLVEISNSFLRTEGLLSERGIDNALIQGKRKSHGCLCNAFGKIKVNLVL